MSEGGSSYSKCPGIINNVILFHIYLYQKVVTVFLRPCSCGPCVCDRAVTGIFKISPPRLLPAFCSIVFASLVVWSLLRQRFFFPFWGLFSFCFFFPHLRESAVSRFELPWGAFYGCLPVAMGSSKPVWIDWLPAPGEKATGGEPLSIHQLQLHNHSCPQRLHFELKTISKQICQLC